ncbi:MAG: type I glyceraldehyde-3-phosphate dehydrogenase [Caldilineaceae bacterium]
MKTRIAVNGFGRIGRLVFRQLMQNNNLEVVAVNDIAPLDNLVYLLRHDSVQAEPGVFVGGAQDVILWKDQTVHFTSVRNPTELPWDEMNVQLVIEASGVFTERAQAAQHLEAGADYVIITAPSKDADVTICMGVNEGVFRPSDQKVLSNASCTTNCLAPVAKVLDEAFGIENGFLTTVHAYTSSQSIVDSPKKKWRRGRAGAVNIVPTTTGAAVATTKVLPQLAGKMDGLAMRVPVPAGSIIDFVVRTTKPVTVEKVNDAFRQAAQDDALQNILGVSDEEIVSSDIIGSTYSALIDAPSTMVLGDHTVKVLAWYDNEWGYARRVADLAAYVSRLGIYETQRVLG